MGSRPRAAATGIRTAATAGRTPSNRNLVTPDASGTRIRLEGTVFDGDGLPINDCMIEIWQADAQGRYATRGANRARPEHQIQGLWPLGDRQGRRLCLRHHQAGRGGGPRAASRRRRTSWSASSRAACCGRSIRGCISDDEAANAADPILTLVPADRRGTLIAHKQAGTDPALYRFDIRVQGGDETVFFDI